MYIDREDMKYLLTKTENRFKSISEHCYSSWNVEEVNEHYKVINEFRMGGRLYFKTFWYSVQNVDTLNSSGHELYKYLFDEELHGKVYHQNVKKAARKDIAKIINDMIDSVYRFEIALSSVTQDFQMGTITSNLIEVTEKLTYLLAIQFSERKTLNYQTDIKYQLHERMAYCHNRKEDPIIRNMKSVVSLPTTKSQVVSEELNPSIGRNRLKSGGNGVAQTSIESEMEKLVQTYSDVNLDKVIELSKQHQIRADLRYYAEGKLWFNKAPDSVGRRYPTEYMNSLRCFIEAIKHGYTGTIFLNIFTIACNLGAGVESNIFSNKVKILYIQLAFQSGMLAIKRNEPFASAEVNYKLMFFSGRSYVSEAQLLKRYLKEVHNLVVNIDIDSIQEWRYPNFYRFLTNFKEIAEGFLKYK